MPINSGMARTHLYSGGMQLYMWTLVFNNRSKCGRGFTRNKGRVTHGAENVPNC